MKRWRWPPGVAAERFCSRVRAQCQARERGYQRVWLRVRRRHVPSGGERTPLLARRSKPVQLRVLQPWRHGEGREAALTTRGRVGTARRPGSGKQPRKGETQVNQWLHPLHRTTGSNLVDVGRAARHADGATVGQRLRSRLRASVVRPRRMPAAYSGRSCRGIAGRRPRRSVHGERGNHPETALPSAQPVRRRAGPDLRK